MGFNNSKEENTGRVASYDSSDTSNSNVSSDDIARSLQAARSRKRPGNEELDEKYHLGEGRKRQDNTFLEQIPERDRTEVGLRPSEKLLPLGEYSSKYRKIELKEDACSFRAATGSPRMEESMAKRGVIHSDSLQDSGQSESSDDQFDDALEYQEDIENPEVKEKAESLQMATDGPRMKELKNKMVKPKWEDFEKPLRDEAPSNPVNVTQTNCNPSIDASESGSAALVKVELHRPEIGEEDLRRGYEDLQTRMEDHYTNDLSWQRPLSWLPELKIKSDEFYVDLDLVQLDSRGCEGKKTEVEGLEDLYKRLEGKERWKNKRILISGEGGFGKTTICLKIAFDWASDADAHLGSFGILFVYHLRDLVVVGEDRTLEDQLLQFCHLDKRITRKILQRVGAKFLVILDGLDEISRERQEEVFNLMKGISKKGKVASAFHRATIIVTSRRLNESNYLENFSQLLRIKGLSKDTQDKLVQNYLNLPEPFKREDWHRYELGTPSYKITSFLSNFNYKTDSSEENGLSPFLLFLVCFCHTESSLPIKSQFGLFQNILEVMGKRCCQKMNLPLTPADRERVILRIGEFFCSQDRYRFTYEKEELISAFKEDSEFVLGFCLFCKVASRSGLNEIISYQLNHKLLHDYVKLNFIGSQARDVYPYVRNQIQGMSLEITDIEFNEFNGLGPQKSTAISKIAYHMDIGDVVVNKGVPNFSVKIYMKPDGIHGGYFRFSMVPGNAATVSELLDAQLDDRLGDSVTKLFQANERAFFAVRWPLPVSNITEIKYTENDEESCSGEDCLSLDLIKLLKKKSIVSPSSNRKLQTLGLLINPIRDSYLFLCFLFNEFLSFEWTFPLWKEDVTLLDLFHNVIGVWMIQPLKEGERLTTEIPFSKSDKEFGSWTFYRWEKSENYVVIKRGHREEKERHVRTIEGILKDKSYLDSLSGLQESFKIKIKKEYKELSIPPKYQLLPLKNQLKHASLNLF